MLELRLALGEAQIDTLQRQLADLSRGRIRLQKNPVKAPTIREAITHNRCDAACG